MKISLSKRIVSIVLCLTVLLAGFAYRPQKAEAVAVTASVVASVAAIMTACGVSYWASTQTNAIDYLGGKIDEYLGSLETVPQSYEDWLGIDAASQLFEVTANGAMRFTSGVANKILAFVRSFASSEDLTAGGDAVVNGYISRDAFQPYYDAVSGGVAQGTVTSSWVGDNTLRIDFSSYGTPSGSGFLRLAAPALGAGYYGAKVLAVSDGLPFDQYLLGIEDETGYGHFSNQKNLVAGYSGQVGPVPNWLVQEHSLTFNLSFGLSSSYALASGYCVFQLSGDTWYTAPTAAFTPASDFSVPSDLASDDDTFDVVPSVPLTQGMSVEDASEAVLYGVVSEDGLTAEGEAVEGGTASGWGWLSDILSAIHDLIAGIAQTVLGIPQAIGQAASDVITGVGNAISTALYNAFVPSEAAIDAFVATLSGNFDNHFSILSYPFSLLGRFVLEVVDAPGAHELVWPDIYEPFSGQRLIAAGSYNLDAALENENFRSAYDIYMTVIKGYIAFQFIAYLYAWFCDVFRMRNDDHSNPIFEQEPIDDGPDDWDGYDSYFET